MAKLVITESESCSSVERFLKELFKKQGIELSRVHFIALTPVTEDKHTHILTSIDIKIPIGSGIGSGSV